jgi:hypothetical protein
LVTQIGSDAKIDTSMVPGLASEGPPFWVKLHRGVAQAADEHWDLFSGHAGCTDADILSHLRSPGPHVRGCWAVDLVLGKE